jgi:hypothetical protein
MLFLNCKPLFAKLAFVGTKIRSLFVYLLMWTIPLQGIAASSMLLCTAEHHGVEQHSMDHDFDQNIGSSDSSAHHANMKNSAKCSACSVCCNLATLPTAFATTATAVAAIAPPSLRAYPIIGPVLEGLKRPPRVFFA